MEQSVKNFWEFKPLCKNSFLALGSFVVYKWARSCENVSYTICEQQRCWSDCADASENEIMWTRSRTLSRSAAEYLSAVVAVDSSECTFLICFPWSFIKREGLGRDMAWYACPWGLLVNRFPLAFVAGWLQGHWWGFISRNYVVWPTFLLMNVFIALKGSHFWFLFDFTAAGVVPCGGRKKSPRTSTIVHFIFYFGPLRSAIIFWEIRNKWLV